MARQDWHPPAERRLFEAKHGDLLALGVPAELVERIAERAAELVAEREPKREAAGWVRGAEAIAAYIDAGPRLRAVKRWTDPCAPRWLGANRP
ncbi:MAG: hypothetical protein ACRDNG_12625, partial [Gaiellaceae bacterium]